MTATQKLLTDDAKLALIKELLPSTDRRGRFFMPDTSFYAPPMDNTGLKQMMRQLSQWVGFKPIGLAVRFSTNMTDAMDFSMQSGKPVILIHDRFRHNAFACGGLLAEGVMRYYFEHRKQVYLSDGHEQQKLTTLAVVYGGLGLVALNHTDSIWEQKYPTLYAKLRGKNTHRTTMNYHGTVRRFAGEYGLELRAVARYLAPWAAIAMRLPTSSNPVDYARAAIQNAKRSSTAMVISLVVIVAGAGIGWFVLTQRPVRLSEAQLAEKDTIDVLKLSYDTCQASVVHKEKIYSDETDFFVLRHIEAHRVRCISIRNLYNAHVDKFNASISVKR